MKDSGKIGEAVLLDDPLGTETSYDGNEDLVHIFILTLLFLFIINLGIITCSGFIDFSSISWVVTFLFSLLDCNLILPLEICFLPLLFNFNFLILFFIFFIFEQSLTLLKNFISAYCISFRPFYVDTNVLLPYSNIMQLFLYTFLFFILSYFIF